MVYSVYCNDTEVGTASVDRQGLFYCISCTCKSSNTEPYRLLLCTNTEQIDLGICPPNSQIINRFSLKRVGEGEPRFMALRLQCPESLIKIDETKQFPYLTKLPQAYLRQKDGLYYVQFKESAKD